MKNPYIALLKTCWHYARNQRKKFLLIYGLFILANLIVSTSPLLLGWFVAKVQGNTADVLFYTFLYVAAFMGLKLCEWCLHGPARVMERSLAFHLSRNFLQEKYHQTLHLPAKWHQDHHSGATISRIREAYKGLRDFFDKGFSYLYTISKFVFSVVAILYFSPLFGSIAVALGMLNVWLISRFDKPYIATLKEVNEKEHQVTSNLFDSLSNIRTVITLRLEESMERGLLGKVRMVFRPFRKNVITNEWKWFVADMMICFIYCVVVAGFVYQNWESGKVFYLAGMVTLLGYVTQFTSVFQNVAGQYTSIIQFHTYVQGVSGISDAYNEQYCTKHHVALPVNWKNIEISELSFSHLASYNKQHIPQSLHKLRLHIQRGQKIALIGESGSGKSTLLSLLRGLYHPENGLQVLVDGVPYTMDSLNESVTLFPQEPEIFENNIAYNVTLGLPFDDDEILQVCSEAHFAEVINQMPDGLLTDIREKGVNLSGGQKQRLALARGILAARNSKLVLLDEPTSSVDPRTEALIYANLFRVFHNKAIISSIHRLHLLDQFDYIYILDKGKIIDEGSFQQLYHHSDAFKAMWEHQKTQAYVQPYE